MESRRRDKLDASYITDLQIIQAASELGSSKSLTSSIESSSDMEASKLISYESITRPAPTVPSRMVLTPPRISQPKTALESKKRCLQPNNQHFNQLNRKISENVLRKNDQPSLFWIENPKNTPNKKIPEKQTEHSKFISVIIKRNDTVLNKLE